jgi:hypothetical protein
LLDDGLTEGDLAIARQDRTVTMPDSEDRGAFEHGFSSLSVAF